MCCVALMGRRGDAVGSRQEGHRSDSQAVFSPATPAAFPETNDVHIGQTGCFNRFIGASVRGCLFVCMWPCNKLAPLPRGSRDKVP